MNRYSGAENFGQAGDWLMGTAKRNPEALLVLAAGVVLLMRGTAKAASSMRASSSFDGHRRVYRYSDFAEDEAARQSGHLAQGVSRAAQRAGDYAADIKDRVAEQAGSYADKAGAYASDLSNRASDLGNRVADTAGAYAATASQYAEGVRRSVSDQAAAVSDYASGMGRTISDQASAWSGYAGELGEQASERVQASVSYMLREQPLAIAVLGLAAGAAAAAMFPPTDVETRAFGAAGEALADRASQIGDNLMAAAGEAGTQLKDKVSERGLNPDSLKEMAKEVAGTFSGKVTGTERAASGGEAQTNRGPR